MTKLRGAGSAALIHQLERLFGQGTSIGSTEGELLERFVTGRDEAAFEALVARHGPMVLGVCRQMLDDPNDVDDAFQATFLILVRKAGTLRQRDLLGNWLYGVAHRVAARARSLSARRMAGVASGHDLAEALTAAKCRHNADLNQATLREQGPWLHQEVSHLPERYRIPIVLCYFEGLTHDEAASRLGWPLGTVKGRLARAKDLLRRRLTRRGVTLSAAALASHLVVSEAKAAVPASLQLATLRAAQSLAYSTGTSVATTAAVSLPVSALVQGVLQTMIANQVKTAVFASLLVVGTVATGVVVGAAQLSGGPTKGGDTTQVAQSQKAFVKKVRGRSGAQPGSPSATALSASQQVVDQLRAGSLSFSNLLAALPNAEIADIDRLRQWSSLTLQADLVLAKDDADRLAALEAHRDRMAKLHAFSQRIPVANKNQSVMADHARESHDEAELWLEGAQHPQLGRMMAGGAMMGGMMGGMVGGGGGGSGMMRSMIAQGSAPGAGVGQSSPNEPAPKDASTPAAKDAGVASAGGQTQPAAMMRGAGMGMMGGMGGGMRGGMSSPEAMNRQARIMIAGSAAEMAAHETNPQSKAILKKLEETISMSFAAETPLDDVLKYIQQATTSATYSGVPIYVDPRGLKEAEATLQSRITLNLEGVPLKTTLRLILKQIGLAYCVREGVLIISSVQGVNEELREAHAEVEAKEPPKPGGLQ